MTEGQKIGGTGYATDKVSIGPNEWGVLDEVSNQVNKMTNVAYASAVQNSAYLGLRKKGKEKITAAILASKLAETKAGIPLDQNYVRTVVLGFDADESVAGGTKLYINKEDIQPLQLYLRKVLTANNAQALMDMGADEMARAAMRAETIKYAVIVVSSIPMLIIYPFVQKFFVKGVMIGAVKG